MGVVEASATTAGGDLKQPDKHEPTNQASGFGSEFSTPNRQVADGIHAFPLTDLWTATTTTFQSAHLFYGGLSFVLGQRYPTGLELGVIGL